MSDLVCPPLTTVCHSGPVHVAAYLGGGLICWKCDANRYDFRRFCGHYRFACSQAKGVYQMSMFFQQRVKLPAGSNANEAGSIVGFPLELAAINEFLCMDHWDETHRRATGSFTVFVEGGKLKCCVNDKETGSIAFVSASSWDDLWLSVENGFRGGSLDWRPARPVQRGR